MKIEEIIEWFMREHSDWVDDKSLVSWARRLGIELNRNGMLDEDGLSDCLSWRVCGTISRHFTQKQEKGSSERSKTSIRSGISERHPTTAA